MVSTPHICNMISFLTPFNNSAVIAEVCELHFKQWAGESLLCSIKTQEGGVVLLCRLMLTVT